MPTHDVRRLRLTRLGALAIAWVASSFIALVHGAPFSSVILSLVYPSPRKLAIAIGIGLQVYRLMKPTTGQARVYEYVETQGELTVLGMILFFDIGLNAMNRGMGGDAIQWGWTIIDFAMLMGLYAGRARVVIDGNTRTVTIGDLVPRTKSFDEVRGLGLVSVTMRRNGVSLGTHHRVGLFVGNGAPTRLDVGGSIEGVDQMIRSIHLETGLQVARA